MSYTIINPDGVSELRQLAQELYQTTDHVDGPTADRFYETIRDILRYRTRQIEPHHLYPHQGD